MANCNYANNSARFKAQTAATFTTYKKVAPKMRVFYRCPECGIMTQPESMALIFYRGEGKPTPICKWCID